MTIRPIILAAAVFGSAALSTANAGGLKPIQGHKIDLGAVNGVAYYTVERGGFRVVATLAQADGAPFRVEALLGPGQSVTLSAAPQQVGDPPAKIEISRRDEQLLVEKVTVTN